MSQFEEAQNVYVFPSLVTGTTMLAQPFVVQINDAAPSAGLSSVTCAFYKDGVATITPTCAITDATNWHFTVGPVSASSMGVAAGLHEGYIKTTDSLGNVRKYVKTQITILP